MFEHLMQQPLLPLALTIGVFAAAVGVSAYSKGHPVANPVLISVIAIILVLSATHTSYERYFAGAQFIHFLLGPATVALAVPLFRHLHRVRACALPILVGIAAGSATGALSVGLIAWISGAQDQLATSLVTKSVTAPVSMAITPYLGGIPSLAAIFSVLTGMVGAAFGPSLLDRLGVHDHMHRGLAMGTASHGQGTARILQESEQAGAFSALAMALAALLMATVMPGLWRLILGSP